MPRPDDLSRSLVALDQNSMIIAVVELIQSSWLVGGVVPGIELVPMRSLTPAAGTTSRQLPQGRAR
jgi:transposase